MVEWIQVGLLAAILLVLYWRDGGKRQVERWLFRLRQRFNRN